MSVSFILQAAEAEITDLVVRFFVPKGVLVEKEDQLEEFKKSVHGLHVLDIYRRSKIFISSKAHQVRKLKQRLPTSNFAMMRSAIELREAGVSFRPSRSPALTSIHFNSRRGILTLPSITVDDNTEFEFLNMVALEHLHADSNSEVSSYVFFMNALIDTSKDVQLLHDKRLICNGLGSNKDLARLFNNMNKEVIIGQGGGILGCVQQEVESYCRQRLNLWRASLIHTYFRNPWSSISIVAAVFVILLTIISTLFSILQWKNSVRHRHLLRFDCRIQVILYICFKGIRFLQRRFLHCRRLRLRYDPLPVRRTSSHFFSFHALSRWRMLYGASDEEKGSNCEDDGSDEGTGRGEQQKVRE